MKIIRIITKGLKFIGDDTVKESLNSIIRIHNTRRDLKIKKMIEKEHYLYCKHHGIIKVLSVIFTIISLFFSILAFQNNSIMSGIVGLIQVILFIYTYLLCLEIIKEKVDNQYKVIFFSGCLFTILFILFMN